jgi:hypothetical protein
MKTKNFLIILVISFFINTKTNCSETSAAGAGRAGAKVVDAATTISFGWLPEGSNTFSIHEVNGWPIEAAVENLQLTTKAFNEYLKHHSPIGTMDLKEADFLTELGCFLKSQITSICPHLEFLISQCLCMKQFNKSGNITLDDRDKRTYESSKRLSCSICSNTKRNKPFFLMPMCGHIFHGDCLIDKLGIWHESKHEVTIDRVVTCPTCDAENFIKSI